MTVEITEGQAVVDFFESESHGMKNMNNLIQLTKLETETDTIQNLNNQHENIEPWS